MTSGKPGNSSKRNFVLSLYPFNTLGQLPCIAQKYSCAVMLTKNHWFVNSLLSGTRFQTEINPLKTVAWCVKHGLLDSLAFGVWFACGFSLGRQQSCWEMCPDFEPAFSLARSQSCSSGRAVSLQITEALSSVRLGEDYANSKMQSVCTVLLSSY